MATKENATIAVWWASVDMMLSIAITDRLHLLHRALLKNPRTAVAEDVGRDTPAVD